MVRISTRDCNDVGRSESDSKDQDTNAGKPAASYHSREAASLRRAPALKTPPPINIFAFQVKGNCPSVSIPGKKEERAQRSAPSCIYAKEWCS